MGDCASGYDLTSPIVIYKIRLMKKKSTSKILPAVLQGKQIAVIGYGSQGRAQALNLRDSGIVPFVGLRAKSKNREVAAAEGFKVFSPEKAISQSDIIAILIPDHKHKELFDNLSSTKLLGGKALIFAHGMSVAFGLVKPPSTCDLILVAPHGPGVRIRELYRQGKSFTSFWAVQQNHSCQAFKIAKGYAAAIGCPASNLFKSTFRNEAIGDIFGEQAVLCGGLTGLLEAGFEMLVKKGFSPETAYLECIYQLDLIIDLIKKYGPAGMFERISVTAAYGSLQSKKKLFDKVMSQKMAELYREIKDGDFVESLMKENRRGMKDFRKDLKILGKSLLQKTHESLVHKMKSN